MKIQNPAKQPVFGCFELDAIGTILYTRIESEGIFGNRQSSIVGNNFFDDFSAFTNIEDFRGHFKRFVKSRAAAEKFTFNYKLEDREIPAKVMLTQISEREYDNRKQLIIVDIRKV